MRRKLTTEYVVNTKEMLIKLSFNSSRTNKLWPALSILNNAAFVYLVPTAATFMLQYQN